MRTDRDSAVETARRRLFHYLGAGQRTVLIDGFGFIGKQQRFKFDLGSYRKRVKGAHQRSSVGEIGEIENKLCSYILDQLLGSDDTRGKPVRLKVQ